MPNLMNKFEHANLICVEGDGFQAPHRFEKVLDPNDSRKDIIKLFCPRYIKKCINCGHVKVDKNGVQILYKNSN